MALIAMAVHDTEENKKSELTRKTLGSICKTVDLYHDRLIIVDNGSCEITKDLINGFSNTYYGCNISSITLPENIGTAKALNLAWKQRRPGEHCIKIDNDVVIHSSGWVEEMEEAIRREPLIGQIGLKRKDCWETTWNENKDYRSTLIQLPHQPGETWITVERAKHIMGTCVMHSAALLDKVGYLWQPTLYGHDDVLMSWRANLAGFVTCFLPHINIDHIDPGGTEYQAWKEAEGGRNGKMVSDIVDEYIAGTRSLYYDENGNQ